MKRGFLVILCILSLLFCSCTVQSPPSAEPSQQQSQPSIKNATFVKAVWIPFMEVEALLSSGDVAASKAAITACMEDCAAKGANTVFFHVRANSDAYYASSVFAPNPVAVPLLEQGFDPLSFAVGEAHARSIAFHAWVNPYRIGTDTARAKTDDIFEFGGKFYYDPASPEAKTLVTDGVRELVENYDIDGVQFDDYFYPKGAVDTAAPAAFEADEYAAYQSAGGGLSVGDWRRWQVSSLVSDVYTVCHAQDGCVFGISPAYDIDDNRDSLYADVEEWASTAGYVDYLCPQLYFGFHHEAAPFTSVLSDWDALERAPSVALYAGLALYKTGMSEDLYAGSGKTEWAASNDILVRQAAAVRAAAWDGLALYSHLSFAAEDGRDAAIVIAEWEAVCAAWRDY